MHTIRSIFYNYICNYVESNLNVRTYLLIKATSSDVASRQHVYLVREPAVRRPIQYGTPPPVHKTTTKPTARPGP